MTDKTDAESDVDYFRAFDEIETLPTARADLAAPKVRALVWHKSHINGWNGDYHTVPTGYTVRCADENGWKWSTPLGAFGYAHSPESAQAAAYEHHRARVLACLETTKPAPDGTGCKPADDGV